MAVPAGPPISSQVNRRFTEDRHFPLPDSAERRCRKVNKRTESHRKMISPSQGGYGDSFPIRREQAVWLRSARRRAFLRAHLTNWESIMMAIRVSKPSMQGQRSTTLDRNVKLLWRISPLPCLYQAKETAAPAEPCAYCEAELLRFSWVCGKSRKGCSTADHKDKAGSLPVPVQWQAVSSAAAKLDHVVLRAALTQQIFPPTQCSFLGQSLVCLTH
jgi:hypothetical protein